MGRAHAFFAVVLTCAALVNASHRAPVHAQGITDLTYGQTVSGQLTRDVFRQVYSFTGRAGDVVDITLTVTGGNLDPILVLTDDQNALVARNDDDGKGYGALIDSLPLPKDGSYFITVARFGQERGLTIGTYSLTLARVGLTQADTGSVLHYGDNIVADIKDDAPEQVYGFAAQRGDLISLAMQRISGDLDPLLILADTEGNVLAVNDEDPVSPGTLDAAIRSWLVRKTGNFMIVATRFGRAAGTSRGGFSLTLDRVAPDSLGFTGDRPILIDYGTTQTGSIDGDTLMRWYQFEAKKGDVLTVNAERTRGNLDPVLTLYTVDQKAITINDAGQRGQNARISAFTVPIDGTYLVSVSRYNGDKGFSAGDYALSVVGRQGVTVGPQGILILQYGGAVSSSIGSANPTQEYVFQGKAGDLVTISMQTTSGDLLPVILLSDSARHVLAQDDPNDSAAQVARFKLPVSGPYVIIASRHGRAGGTSSGNYLLTLTRETS